MSRAHTVPARLRIARRLAVAGALLLGACVLASATRAAAWPHNLLWTAILLAPLALPLPGLLRGQRRTCAWATLCVAPYVVYGTTEVVANPAVRGSAAAILLASLAWFATLVYCLRVSGSAPIASAGDQAGPVD